MGIALREQYFPGTDAAPVNYEMLVPHLRTTGTDEIARSTALQIGPIPLVDVLAQLDRVDVPIFVGIRQTVANSVSEEDREVTTRSELRRD